MNKQQDGIDFLPYLVMPTNFTNASTTIHKRSRSSSATRVRAGSTTRCSSRSRSTSRRSRSSSRRSSSTTRSRQRSNSATRLSSTTTNRNTNNSSKRRESMGLIQRRRSYKTTTSSNIDTSTTTNDSIIKYCNIHTSVKIRSGKCPICTAGEIKRRKSLDNNSEVALDKLKRRNSNGSLKTESDDIPPPTVDKLEVNNDNKTKDIDVNVDTNIDQAITEEAAVLDEKWVNVLRSITLANKQKAKDKSIIEDSTQEVATDHDIQIDTPKETDETEDVKQLPPSNKTKVQSKTATTNQALTELQQIISRATMSIGKFTVNKKDDVDEEKNDKHDKIAEDDDNDDNSFSSFAMNESIGIKTFAESKDEQLPPHPTSKQTPPQHGLDVLDTISKPTGKEEVVNTSTSSHSSSSSDSSVTLSVSTLESYNSLAASPSILNKLKKSHALTPNMHNSPTSVLDTKALYSEQVEDEEEEEGEGGGDLGSSFYMHEPKSYSEKKVAAAPSAEDDKSNVTSSVHKPSKVEEIIVEDVMTDSSDEEEVESQSQITSTAVKSQLPSQMDQPSKYKKEESAFAEDVNDCSDNEESPSPITKILLTPPPTKSRRPSFFSSLVQNVRSRSLSRSRRRSKSRSTSLARRESSRSSSRTRSDLKVADTLNEKQNEVNTVSSPPVDLSFEAGSRSDAKPQQSSSSPKPNIEAQPVIDNTIQRGPISHPSYQLGDVGRDQDMIIFPKSKTRQSRSRRRRRRSKKDDGDTSNSDSDDDEDRSSRRPACQVNISLAIGQLRHLDAAFVRRSKGGWSYAIVADGNHDEIRFVVNATASTKTIPKEQWKSCIRRVKVLTPREGDKIPEPSPQRRSLGRSSFRQRGKTKGRFVSPSPTRRSAGVINIPSTIMEGSSYT